MPAPMMQWARSLIVAALSLVAVAGCGKGVTDMLPNPPTTPFVYLPRSYRSDSSWASTRTAWSAIWDSRTY